jgi:carbon-monoxide dehydrogenase small subunit
MKQTIQVKVNGRQIEREVEPRTLLVHFLREELGLTGTHIGCETSVCGACTVMLEGRTAKSCTVLAVQCDGKQVETIESLAADGELHVVQEAFWNEHGLQCGFCTPGMILSVCQLLNDNPNPSREQIRHGIEGNLCRCTGYQHIVKAVEAAAQSKAEA